MVNRCGSWWNPDASPVPAQRAEKSTVRRTGLLAMEPGDNIDFVFVRFERADRLGQCDLRKRGVVFELFGNAGRRIESLVLEKKDDTFGGAWMELCRAGLGGD